MKKIISTSILLLITIFSQAQNIVYFQVENEHHILSENFKPNTQLQAYSTTQGGKKIAEFGISSMGNNKQIFSLEDLPAFILNRLAPKNPNGSNIVYLIPAKEFHLKNVRQHIEADEIDLTWDASVEPGKNIQFQIEKILPNGKVEIVKSLPAEDSKDFVHYEIALPYDDATFKIKVFNNVSERVVKEFSFAKMQTARAYPTVCNQTIYVDIVSENTSYKIFDINGKLLQQGNLLQWHNSVSVQGLSQGVYFMLLSNNDRQEKQSIRFVKE